MGRAPPCRPRARRRRARGAIEKLSAIRADGVFRDAVDEDRGPAIAQAKAMQRAAAIGGIAAPGASR